MIIFWILFFVVCYASIVFILFKGKQHNRFFGTLLCTIFPIVGSLPGYIIASKYERRISNNSKKINNNILKYIIVAMQILSVLLLLLPYYRFGSQSASMFNLIFGGSTYGEVIKPVVYMSYIIILPVLSAIANLIFKKSNVSNFATFFISFLNMFSVLVYSFIITAFRDVSSTLMIWVYAIFNVLIIGGSIVSLVVNRDRFLFELEYSEKIEYIKEQKKKVEKKQEEVPEKNTYKCSKCGNRVEKGTHCSCLEKKSRLIVTTQSDLSSSDDVKTGKGSESFLPASFCVYCKKPLGVGEACDCQGSGFGITVKNESDSERKCSYCGKVLVGESTCVCEKIMKNSSPRISNNDTKKYFESEVEKGNVFIANELAQLEQKINSKFDLVKDNISSSDVYKDINK